MKHFRKETSLIELYPISARHAHRHTLTHIQTHGGNISIHTHISFGPIIDHGFVALRQRLLAENGFFHFLPNCFPALFIRKFWTNTAFVGYRPQPRGARPDRECTRLDPPYHHFFFVEPLLDFLLPKFSKFPYRGTAQRPLNTNIYFKKEREREAVRERRERVFWCK